MGGDDLASDDEYGGPLNASDVSDSVSSEIDGNRDQQLQRKRNNNNDLNSSQVETKSKKRRKKIDASTSSKSLLILSGRRIAFDGVDSQSKFINSLYSHSIKMSMGASSEEDGSNKSNTFSFTLEHFYTTPPETNEKTKQFLHKNLDAFLKGTVSMKRLKNWKHQKSPMVIVVTLSARRSVELMKGLSSFKLPVAKLFAKHVRVEDQVELLKGKVKGGKYSGNGGGGGGGGGGGKTKSRCYSIAVGTPGRLLTLLRHGRDEPGGDGLGALRLNHTEVIILDTHEDSKGFNVCTLQDTSSDLMHFMKEGVVPQLGRKKGKMKIAMF